MGTSTACQRILINNFVTAVNGSKRSCSKHSEARVCGTVAGSQASLGVAARRAAQLRFNFHVDLGGVRFSIITFVCNP